MIQTEEIKASIVEAAKKKKRKRCVQRVLKNADEYAINLQQTLNNGEWFPPEHEEHLLREGYHKKERMIQKPRWDNEQIVHHMLIRQLQPIIQPKLHRYVCGSIKGRGAHYLLKAMKSWVKGYGQKRFYAAELDIRKFYDNIDLHILKGKLDKLIRDRAFKEVLFRVIGDGDKGLPKGFYTSPWLAHYYLLGADNYIQQELKPDHYARYVDNIWLLHRNKRELRKMMAALWAYLNRELHLSIKEDWQIFRFENTEESHGRFINLLGFNIHRRHVGIRKGILKRIRAKAMRIKRKGHVTFHDASSVVSRMGYFKFADAHRFYLTHIKPYISIRYLKWIIRKHTRQGGIANDRLENCRGRQQARPC